MKVLVAEDDPALCELLSTLIESWGYEVVTAHDGKQAWQIINSDSPPRLIILDWLMPHLSGLEICRRIKKKTTVNLPYLLLLTSMDSRENLIEGLKAGADDYVTKPFDINELEARINVGRRVIKLQDTLNNRLTELQNVLDHVKTLQGIIPICSHCHKIRNDEESWQLIEQYLSEHTNAQFSHGICPECLASHYQELIN